MIRMIEERQSPLCLSCSGGGGSGGGGVLVSVRRARAAMCIISNNNKDLAPTPQANTWEFYTV